MAVDSMMSSVHLSHSIADLAPESLYGNPLADSALDHVDLLGAPANSCHPQPNQPHHHHHHHHRQDLQAAYMQPPTHHMLQHAGDIDSLTVHGFGDSPHAALDSTLDASMDNTLDNGLNAGLLDVQHCFDASPSDLIAGLATADSLIDNLPRGVHADPPIYDSSTPSPTLQGHQLLVDSAMSQHHSPDLLTDEEPILLSMTDGQQIQIEPSMAIQVLCWVLPVIQRNTK